LGEGAYMRDTFNCIDFLVIFLQFLLLIVDISSNVTGARSARFVRYIRFARIRYLRLFRRIFKFNALRGPNFRLMWLEARAEDTVEIAQAIERGRVVFEPATAETIEYTLRVLPPDVLRLACGLIDEMYNEMFDPALVAAYSQQTDAVHQTVQEANKDLVYEWLATVAEPGQKRVFMTTLTNIRNVGARLGAEGVAREMARQRYDSVEISNADAFVIPETDGGKDSAKAYKRRALRDAKSSSFASTKATISKQFDMFHTSLTNDDKVEDALNALPLLSVNEDEQMRELYKSKLALEQRLMVSDIEVDAPRAARAKAIKAEAAKAEAEAAAPAPARASWFGKK
jgi:hypothetical protein